MVEFTEEQVREMEDKIINKLFPIHGYLHRFLVKGSIEAERVEMMIQNIDKAVEWIRSQRPEHKRMTRYR